MTLDCRHRPRPIPTALLRVLVCVVLTLALLPAIAAAQPAAGHAAQAAGEHATEGRSTGGEHSGGVLALVARLVNFAALAGVLAYFLRKPIAGYLDSRGSEIRQDLVAAARMRSEATAQLADIERKLKSLPAELDALTARGAEDMRLERERLSEGVAAERERLLDHTRREIAMRLRVARRELIEYAAELAVRVAEQRVKRAITAEDHLRLMDRYTTQLEDAR